MESPEAVVQRQLDAYNAKDLDAWLATYAPDAQQFEFPNTLLAQGHAQMRERMRVRFSEPDLFATLNQRIVMGAMVVDYERVTRNFPEGFGTIEMLCVYQVSEGLIQRAVFSLGEQKLHTSR
jgi:hypothetical protein